MHDIYNLKTFTLTGLDDPDKFKILLVPDVVIDRLRTYLFKNNLTVVIRETYDPQSSWCGHSVIIDGEDLSLNGYCFNGNRLAKFLVDKGY